MKIEKVTKLPQVRTAERQKMLNKIGLGIIIASLMVRGLQFYHWYNIGFDMKSYNPYVPIFEFLWGHLILATAIVASLPFTYYIAAFVNYLYDGLMLYGLLKWGYLSPTMGTIIIIIVIITFFIVFYMIRAYWFKHFEGIVNGGLGSGYK